MMQRTIARIFFHIKKNPSFIPKLNEIDFYCRKENPFLELQKSNNEQLLSNNNVFGNYCIEHYSGFKSTIINETFTRNPEVLYHITYIHILKIIAGKKQTS